MQKFQSNLLIVFALCLCVLCAFQWVRESHLRTEIEKLNKIVYKNKEAIQNLEATIKRGEAEITRLDALKNELIETVRTNRQEILTLTKYSEKLEKEAEASKAQINVYKDAIEKANDNLRKQNESIKQQNEQLKQLAEDRNAAVEKYNKAVEQYNELVKQFEKFQQDVQKQQQPNKSQQQPSK